MLFYNNDVFDVTADYNNIAEVYFRLGADQYKHTRKVFQFYDWLGSIGGVTRVLGRGFNLFFGTYIQLTASIAIMNSLYHGDDHSHEESSNKDVDEEKGQDHEGGAIEEEHKKGGQQFDDIETLKKTMTS